MKPKGSRPKSVPRKRSLQVKQRPGSASSSSSLWVRHKKLFRWLIGIAVVIIALAIAVMVWFRVSPWPNSMLIRYAFNKDGTKTAKAVEKYVPSGIVEVSSQQYRAGDKDAYLDVFYPLGTVEPRPTVVWVHGGAWVSGNKDQIDNYLKILASHGYTTVGVNYSIAPEHKYPTPLHQVNDALAYLQQNAKRLNIDDTRIVMAGDSAGSQIVAQIANIITSPDYAREIGISPKLEASKLVGLLLNCGAYDLSLPDYNGPFGGFLKTVLWAYSGKKDFLNDPVLEHASVVNYVTPNFPPSFITAGNDDPLEEQSTEFAKKLQSLGVPVVTRFYPKNHEPKLGHEYQFSLDLEDSKQALDQMVQFLNERIAKSDL